LALQAQNDCVITHLLKKKLRISRTQNYKILKNSEIDIPVKKSKRKKEKN